MRAIPEFRLSVQDLFTAEQMQAYARASLAATPAPADLRHAAEQAKYLIVSSLCHQTTTRNQWKLVVDLLNKALGE